MHKQFVRVAKGISKQQKGKCIRGKDTEQRNGYGLQIKEVLRSILKNLARMAKQNTKLLQGRLLSISRGKCLKEQYTQVLFIPKGVE